MRILFLNPVGAVGGAERCLLTMLAALRRDRPGASLHLICCTDGPLIGQARALGVETRVVSMPPALSRMGDSALKRRRGRIGALFALMARAAWALPAARRYLRALRDAVRAVRPTLIHSNGVKTHLLCAALRPRCPVVWHLHDFVGARPVVSRLLQRVAGSASSAVAVSRAVAADAAGVLGGDVPVRVLHNAVDLERFAPAGGDGSRLDALAGLAPTSADIVRVGLVATYAKWKGHDMFLDAAAGLADHFTPDRLRFYIVGGPIYQTSGSQWTEPELRQRAREAGLDNGRVGFVPFCHEMPDVYRGLDIVVHASVQPEPFGLTIAEAMSCGRAVIVSRAGGAAELFQDGHDALGVTPGDVQGLADTIGRLVADGELRHTLARNARQSAVRRFGDERLAGELAAVYDHVLATEAPAPVDPPRAESHRSIAPEV
ncbi:MAG: glycosyltransferase family 4 protein [Tepidisphaeraceae bacterium]